MTETLITYSLIKSIYEKGKDYLDVFVPFILNSFPDGQQQCSLDDLTKNLEEKFGLKIPEHTLNTIITRATRRGYVIRKEKKCLLTEKGRETISETKRKQDEEKRSINALVEDIKNFIQNKYQVEFNSEQVKKILEEFVKKHLSPLIEFFNPQYLEEWEDKNQIYLIDYLKLAKTQKPVEFSIIERICYGAIISSVIFRKDISEINRKFSSLQIFLDTNVMFSIMDLHYPYICKPAKEAFELLKLNKFQIKVFDFTINEMVRVLQGYTKVAHKYSPNVKVDSIYSNLKSKGWTRGDCINFISKIEQKIYELGIQIEYTGINDLGKWEPPNKEIYSRLSQYKPDQNPLGQKHDICAIEKIKEIRKRPKREMENCSAVFLTSDLKLSRFNFIELGHNDNMTVPEVISDRFLTTFLWLKNPKNVKNLPLETILSIQSEILIDRTIWDRFYDNLVRLKNEGKVSEEDISILIYYHQIEQDFASISNADEITEEFILKEIEKAKEKIDEETKRKIEEEKKKIDKEYTEKIAKKDEEYLRQIERIKNSIMENAKKMANIYSYLIISISSVLLLYGGIHVLLFTKDKNLLQKIGGFASLIGSIFSILQFFGIQIRVFNLKTILSDYLFNKIYKKRLSELKIQEVKE